MSTLMIYSTIGLWFTLIAALVGFAAFAGVHMSLGTTAVALAVGLMPPAMMLRLRVAAEAR